jgi:hypothetical protein
VSTFESAARKLHWLAIEPNLCKKQHAVVGGSLGEPKLEKFKIEKIFPGAAALPVELKIHYKKSRKLFDKDEAALNLQFSDENDFGND